MVSILNIKCVDQEEEDSLDIQMGLIADLISTQFKNFTIPEIQEAMKMYVSKKFDVKVFRLLDCISIGEILTAYTEYRNEATKVFTQKRTILLNSGPEITETQKKQIFNDLIVLVFEEISENGFSKEAWGLYDVLDSNSKIKASKQEKKDVYSRQLSIYILEEKAHCANKDPLVAREIMKETRKKIASETKLESVVRASKSFIACEYLKGFKTIEEFKKEIYNE